ncbi:MAG: hypothetical protein KA184_03330 [Candidatus Hydrogenedentes bacterium]|nr:hypothetical protein [Candidatus Hydrogenedentota bacterium]
MKRRGFLAALIQAALLACAPPGWAARRMSLERVVVARHSRCYPGEVKSWNAKQKPGPGPWAG